YDTAAEIRLHQAQVRFLGNLMRWNPPRPAEGQPAPELGAVEKGRFLSLVAEPARVTIDVSHAGRGRPVPSGMGQSIPGMLTMFVVMSVLIGGSAELTKERDLGTLRRLATTTLSKTEVFGGKLAGLLLMGLAQAFILVVVSEMLGRFGLANVNFSWVGHLPGLIPLLLAFCFCIASLGIFLSGLFKTTQQAESLAWLVGMVLAGLGGCWWPLEIVPATMQTVGHLFPTAWAMDGLHALITFGDGFAGVVTPVLVLMAFGTVFALLGTRTMRITD
ncbi:MAG: ABC transporter permease, partial [Gemmatimonadetes bacterium]|nr:ABC transporter permease [Gemmatimonadota bacterium]